MVVRALNGGTLTGCTFWYHLRICKENLGFELFLDKPDVWIFASTNADVKKYFEYVLLYVDDCLVISDKSEDI